MTVLKPKQERFCQEYIIDYNGTNAAIRAGYEQKAASQQAARMLRNVNILARIRELQQEQVKRLAVSQDYVITQLIDTYNCCRQPKPVMEYDYGKKEWVESGVYQFDSKGALKALELLGKHLGTTAAPGAETEDDPLSKSLAEFAKGLGSDAQ